MPEPFSLPRPEPLRAFLPSLRDMSAYLDAEFDARVRRRTGSLIAWMLAGDDAFDPVRHPEGREDPNEYA